MSFQALVDGLSQQWMKERAESQMTLGSLIEALSAMPAEAPVQKVADPHSYRGYYSDLSFEPGVGMTTAGELLALCKGCMGEKFTGYKGGDYWMSGGTPVWLAFYGSCGEKIVGIKADGTLETAEDTF